jgi:hypothetical protein
MTDYTKVGGIRFPTRRRIYPRLLDGWVAAEPLVVSIEISDIILQRAKHAGSQLSDRERPSGVADVRGTLIPFCQQQS